MIKDDGLIKSRHPGDDGVPEKSETFYELAGGGLLQ